MNIKALAVFCGSKSGSNDLFSSHAAALGKSLLEKNITLIYGGGSKGLMGAIADEMMKGGGKVIGVIPEVLVKWEHQHEGITQLIVVDNMHTRKKKMYELCDAAVILPGGFGTLDEMFEMVTWNQLSIHNKKIFILNSAGFYDHLIEHIKHTERNGFLYENAEERFTVVNTPEALHQYLL